MKIKGALLGPASTFVKSVDLACRERFAPRYRPRLKKLYREVLQAVDDYNDLLAREKRALGFAEGGENPPETIRALEKYVREYWASDIELDMEPIVIDVEPEYEEISRTLTPAVEAILDPVISLRWLEAGDPK